MQLPADGEMDVAFAQRATLGECLQWHGPTGRWWWTDIDAGELHAWSPDTGKHLRCRLPDRLCCFAHARSGRLILGMAHQLCFGRLAGLEADGAVSIVLEPITPVDSIPARTRINDGRCDRRGNLVFGTMDEAQDPQPIGGFYQYAVRHGVRRLDLPAAAISNSICFSLDGRRMFFCDTLTRTIQQCDYEADTARVGNIRPFVHMEDTDAWPDGSVIDAEDCLWNAQWGSGRVRRYAPDGRLLQVLRLAAPHCSCPALGGQDGMQLMVTTARQGLGPAALHAVPQSGSLFGQRLPQRLAVAETLFDDGPC